MAEATSLRAYTATNFAHRYTGDRYSDGHEAIARYRFR